MFRNSIIIIFFDCFQQLECILVFLCILYIKYYVYSLLYSLIYCIGHRVKNTTFELNFHSTSFNPNEFESFDSIRFNWRRRRASGAEACASTERRFFHCNMAARLSH